MGVVAPNGIGLDAYWDSLINCKSGIGPITLFDTKDFTVKIAGEVRDFDLRDYFGRDCKPNRLGRQTQLGLVACRMAIEHAGLTKEIFQRATPLNLVVGICSSAADIIESAKELIIKHGPDRVRPYMVGACQPHAISAAFVQLLDVQTSVSTISSACPSGLDAIETAAKMIKKGEADLVIAGAADSPLNATGLAGFAATGVLSKMEDPKDASRPFDLQRDGVVFG
jgi:3-oxoacyl-[acyl-carrier-protein] synthase II